MLYISVYQLIKTHIETKSEWGKKLLATKRVRKLNVATQISDAYMEAEYSSSCYDQELVFQLIKETVNEKRTDQALVLIEGLCNANKFEAENDKIELRLMDEFLNVEAHIGEVVAIVGL